ncbi:MAG: hypothetical protein QNL04_10860 [SAR324 cluster bacterium]|nr:hypothetical protein [SAR324 cluster bacterium]
MKILYPDRIQLVDAGPAETLSEYPITYIKDDHLLRPWRADSGLATSVEINLRSDGVSDCLAIFGMELDQILIEVFSDDAMTTLVDSKLFLGSETEIFGSSNIKNIWYSFPVQSLAWFKLTVTTLTITTPMIGRVSCGKAATFVNPKWGFGASIQDHGTQQRLKNGSMQARNKATSRAPKLNFEIPMVKEDALDQYYGLIELYEKLQSADPFACLMVEGRIDQAGTPLDQRYVIWGRFAKGSFSALESSFSFHQIDFTLEESI